MNKRICHLGLGLFELCGVLTGRPAAASSFALSLCLAAANWLLTMASYLLHKQESGVD